MFYNRRENLSYDDTMIRQESIISKINHLERQREQKLLDEKKIGQVVERQNLLPQRQIVLKKANFAWQKMNNRIGA